MLTCAEQWHGITARVDARTAHLPTRVGAEAVFDMCKQDGHWRKRSKATGAPEKAYTDAGDIQLCTLSNHHDCTRADTAGLGGMGIASRASVSFFEMRNALLFYADAVAISHIC